MIEIERKFIVTSNDYITQAQNKTRIVQGFLNKDPERTVRVRIKGAQGFITVKGKSNQAGTSRFEWEKEISVEEAKLLLNICEKGTIDKYRYEVKVDNHTFEVDEFLADNEGLIIAEVELLEEEETFTKPFWIGKEVTGEVKYYNSQLSENPFKEWG